MSDEVKADDVHVNGTAPPAEAAAAAEGADNGADGEVAVEPEVQLPPITIRVPRPTSARSLPKSAPSSLVLKAYSQPGETLQEVKLAVGDWPSGYWLGPFAFRLPGAPGAVVGTSKDGVEVRAGEKLSDWLEVGDLFAADAAEAERVLDVVREPYSDVSARQAVLRLLDLIAPAGTSTHTLATPLGVAPGSTIFEAVRDGRLASEPVYEDVEVALPSGRKGKAGKKETVKVRREVDKDAHAFADWKAGENGLESAAAVDVAKLPVATPAAEALPCVRAIQLSPFNPPPAHCRQQGHLLYLQVTTLEGDVYTLVCVARGWYVSRSNVNQFDAAPRAADAAPVHSLVDLLHALSPQFSERLHLLAPLAAAGDAPAPAADPLATVAIPQADPAYPWVAPAPRPPVADVVRTQLAYLHTGATTADALDSARDWNEEIQAVRELPRATMQERVFRERLAHKTWQEYTQASVRAVLSVARGDVLPLNPQETPRNHMWLVSNIFVTKAVDSIGLCEHVGGDAAAHVSQAKDAEGVRLLNKLDIDGVYSLGHTVVDWAGERWVCQTVLPGIFTHHPADEAAEAEAAAADGDDEAAKEPTPNPLIIYGVDAESKSTVHWDEATHGVMAQVASALRLAPHTVASADGPREFYASTDVKALRGTDGRRYLLDLPRLSPVDIEWLEKDVDGALAGPGKDVAGPEYPHKMALLRPELVETYWENELKRWARAAADRASAGEKAVAADGEGKKDEAAEGDKAAPAEVDPSAIASAKEFELRFNPDAFVAANGDAAPFADEADPAVKAVRDASVFLRSIAVPAFAVDVLTGAASVVMDGTSLSKQMHARGINMRYLGYLAQTVTQFATAPAGANGADAAEPPADAAANGTAVESNGEAEAKVEGDAAAAPADAAEPAPRPSGQLVALKTVIVQEMVVRACKHILRRLIRDLAPEHAQCAVAHFLNCLFETAAAPAAVYEPLGLAPGAPAPAYVALTPADLREQIADEVKLRFRWALEPEFAVRKVQLLRELASRFAFQLVQRDYFGAAAAAPAPAKDGGKKKGGAAPAPAVARKQAFEPSDVITLLPVVRGTAPSVTIAEEILEAGRATINRGSVEMGLDVMLEAVTMYESIHQVIHPEVAQAYNQYAFTVQQIARIRVQQIAAAAAAAAEQGTPQQEEPLGLDLATGLRLQRQAVIIAERTLGVYHPDTASYYLQLAMLENIDGNGHVALRYFRHLLSLWDVIYGPDHPEIITLLTNAGVVLQALGEHATSLALLQQAAERTVAQYGARQLQHAQVLHQLTQAHFLVGDLAAALATATDAHAIFAARLGADGAQTKEVAKNVELLRTVVDGVERQKQAGEMARQQAAERLRAAQARVAGPAGKRRVLAPSAVAPAIASGSAAPAAAPDAPITAPQSRIGERGHLELDELVSFIQGGGAGQGKGGARGKNALRGKRRTGAKR